VHRFHFVVVVLLLALVGLAPLAAEEVAPPIFRSAWDFDQKPAEGAWAATATGEAARRMPTPKRIGDKLYLLQSWMDSSAAIAFPAPTTERVRVIQAAFTLVMNTGTEGAGFVWLPTEAHGAKGDAPAVEAWEAPSLEGAFGIGFDASNPPNRDPFRGSGNAYDRPQHEVSLQRVGN